MEDFYPVPGFNGYSITQTGVIRGKFGKILRQQKNLKGYPVVTLRIDDEKKTVCIHKLVALTFLPNPENKPQIDHIDRDITNNSVNNLRWVSGSENCENKTAKNYYYKAIHQRCIEKIKRSVKFN
jgi:hypothetical protein